MDISLTNMDMSISKRMTEYLMKMPVDRMPNLPGQYKENLKIGYIIKDCIDKGIIKNFRLDENGKIDFVFNP